MKIGIAIALLLSGAILSGFYAVQERKSTVNVPVTVHAKDTMWGICEREASIAGDKRDLREIVFKTNAVNGIKDGGRIYPGQKIIVRVQIKGER